MARQERAIRTRRLILEAAGAIFAERGYEGASLADVYARAGLTKGAFYFHFDSKQHLAQAVLEAQIGQGRYPVVPRTLKLQELVDAGLVFAHLLGQDTMLQGSVRLSLEPGTHGLDRQGPFRDWIERCRATLAEARDRGELYPHVEPGQTAELFVGAFSGVQVLSKVMADHADLEYRVIALMTHLFPAVAVPGALARLDMTPGRGARVLDEAGARVLDEAGARVLDEAGARVLDEAGARVLDEAGARVLDAGPGGGTDPGPTAAAGAR
ncbi:ScbR family autoregulator-binding transcription factor [Kitasatospora sp. NBC_00315]|uniref:ScbR family autoregulator-binding transcription factor n=1 Tax=Kitasatospora sp. NBC_00315 TaxID=2975963 RepID=UPI00324ED455